MSPASALTRFGIDGGSSTYRGTMPSGGTVPSGGGAIPADRRAVAVTAGRRLTIVYTVPSGISVPDRMEPSLSWNTARPGKYSCVGVYAPNTRLGPVRPT